MMVKAESSRRNALVLIGSIVVGISLFSGGYALGAHDATRRAQAAESTAQRDPFTPLFEVWDILRNDYVNQPLDEEAMVEAAIDGMIGALDDPYTSYMTPEEFDYLLGDLDGAYEGIGAEVSQDDDGFLIIVTPIAGSPAEEAGLLPGDRVSAVDGIDIRGMDLTEIILLVRGPAGTPVTLTIHREGVAEPFDVTITRGQIDIEEVTWRMVDGDIAYLRLTEFSSNADEDIHAALRDIMRENPSGIILDLRGNPGGLLNVALSITSEFLLGGDPILTQQWGDGRLSTYDADPGGLATDIPLVVLIDGGSASASELLAGALHDHERATLVGSRTFGKGTVQTWHDLSNGGGLRITIARWLTPTGHWIHGNGIEPDVYVNWPVPIRADSAVDPELEAAIRVMRGQTNWPTWPLTWLDAVSAAPLR